MRRLPRPLHNFIMLLTPRQWAWVAMYFAILATISLLGGCTSAQPVVLEHYEIERHPCAPMGTLHDQCPRRI